MKTEYINNLIQQFEYNKSLGEKTINQLKEKDLFWQYQNESNSIAIIVNHLYGNMMSRWTDFLISDGEKKWRNRDAEFENTLQSKAELIEKWEEGWNCLFEALKGINENNFNSKIKIRNEEHSITEAILRQLSHYSYHIGQIVYLGKMIQDTNWKSISIPKGKSEEYNQKKILKEKNDT